MVCYAVYIGYKLFYINDFCAEVRPAPHMDNLVGIYKSMEDASGTNIFMTQSAPSTKSAGILLYMHFQCNSCFNIGCMFM